MTEIVKVFHYEIISERPLDKLLDFHSHRRLKVFLHKGTKCVSCDRVGTRLIQGQGRGGIHWDVYTDDLYPLTVDHIIPRSKGGSDELENLQPMCAECNTGKGNGEKSFKKQEGFVPKGYIKCTSIEDVNVLVGKTVWKLPSAKAKGNKKRVYELGTLSQIVSNPDTKIISAIIAEKPGVFYQLQKLFISKEECANPETGTLTIPTDH